MLETKWKYDVKIGDKILSLSNIKLWLKQRHFDEVNGRYGWNIKERQDWEGLKLIKIETAKCKLKKWVLYFFV